MIRQRQFADGEDRHPLVGVDGDMECVAHSVPLSFSLLTTVFRPNTLYY